MTETQQTFSPVAYLNERLCFSLYSSSKAVIGAYKPHLDKLGITYPQYLVLISLYEHIELTVSELGAMLFLDLGTTTPLLKRMEHNGHIVRTRSKDDERVVTVRLTKQGLELQSKIGEMQKDVVCSLGMEKQDIVALRDTLQGLNVFLRSNSKF